MHASEPIRTRIFTLLEARMQRTHDRRRASFFVGPAGIGKSTAVEAFRRANLGEVLVVRVSKRNVTGTQILQQLLLALKQRRDNVASYISNATAEVQRHVCIELDNICSHLGDARTLPDVYPGDFPFLTIVFDEAQRLSNGAIDALRDFNEPHYHCRGRFPLGMIFVGNNELSLEASRSGTSILDEGMQDRLLYRQRLSYEDVERADVELFVRTRGIDDDGAVATLVASYFTGRVQLSFRRVEDDVQELLDEAGGAPITRDVVRHFLSLEAA